MEGWSLSLAQQRALERQLRHIHDAGTWRRLLALLHAGQGQPIAEVAQWLQVDRRSVYRWVNRFVASRQLLALEHQPGQGRPRIGNEDLVQALEVALAHSPRELGYPANTWSVPVLQAFLAVYFPELEVSARTVRRRLKELGYVWKRFRYVLMPDPQAEKKTPDPGANTDAARGHGALGRG